MGASFCLYCSNYILFTAAKFFLSFFLCFLSRIFSPFGTGILIISTMERTSVKESCYSFANPKATIVFNFFFFSLIVFHLFYLILSSHISDPWLLHTFLRSTMDFISFFFSSSVCLLYLECFLLFWFDSMWFLGILTTLICNWEEPRRTANIPRNYMVFHIWASTTVVCMRY